MNEQLIQELFFNDAFISSLIELETAEDVQKTLADKGVELTVDEIKILKVALVDNDGELTEDKLGELTDTSLAIYAAILLRIQKNPAIGELLAAKKN